MKFDSLSFNQLISVIDERFYNRVRSKADLFDYLNALYRASCRQNGVRGEIKPLEILLMRKPDYSIFYPQNLSSGINMRLIDKFDLCRITKNSFYPFLLATAVLHESRHHAQAVSSSKVTGYLKQIAKLKTSIPAVSLTIGYHTNPSEVDARNYCFQTFKKYPFANKYQSHRDFYKSEISASKADTSSVFQALLRIKNSFLELGQPTDPKLKQFVDDLQKSCFSFLKMYDINPDDFHKAMLNYNLKMDAFLRCTKRPTEFKILSEQKETLAKELSDKIYADITFPKQELKHCKDSLSMLKIRPEAKEYAFYQLKVDAYRLLESRLLYREFGHDFINFESLLPSAARAPREEVEFMREYKGIKKAELE